MDLRLESIYSEDDFIDVSAGLLGPAARCRTLERSRERLLIRIGELQALFQDTSAGPEYPIVRDCARAFRSMLMPRSEDLAGHSVLSQILSIHRHRRIREASPAFHAEFIHLIRGLEGGVEVDMMSRQSDTTPYSGRDAALRRSEELDRIWGTVETWMGRWPDGLSPEAVALRAERRRHVLEALGGGGRDWDDWRWQTRNLILTPGSLGAAVPGMDLAGVEEACRRSVPFAVTPYYASLLEEGPAGERDRALRAQVIPHADYLESFPGRRGREDLDFMRERDTSPVGLVTRRYPAIVILKPYNACPQICVYCQRNWEIDGAMTPVAQAADSDLDRALEWISEHDSIKEVLVTGGDPLAMEDEPLERILGGIAAIGHVDLIRIGTRTPVTLPMRFTPRLLDILSGIRSPGRREIVIVTHIQHPYEISPETVRAVDSVRMRGIAVYNQLVFTYHVSRRFEAARLRMLLRRCGIDPYYTFVPKGKAETASYRVPIARILQEQQEEARLIPGSRRTDAPVYNVPGLGKNYLRAVQNRDLLSIRHDGARLYEFHPWEKNVVRQNGYIGEDVPILDYLSRLASDGEDISDYSSIWYYY